MAMADAPLRLLPDNRDSGGILPWVIAAMVYLTALAIAGSFGLHSAAQSWTSGLAQTLTVQIPVADSEDQKRQTVAVLDALRGTVGVVSARSLEAAELDALLEPWLGKGNVSDDLPIPALIDVQLDKNAMPDRASLEASLRAVAPAARVDDQQQWLGKLSNLTRSFEWTANLIVVLVAFATMAIVAFGTRAGLANHHPTISILHLMGAEDGLIAKEFQRRFLMQGLQGGLVGVLLAGITIAIIGIFIKRAGDGLIGSVNLPWTSWVALLLLPLVAGVLTMFTARWTVHRALREIL
jgi:cell division transport system permease protein